MKSVGKGCALALLLLLGLFVLTLWRCGPGALPSDARLKKQFELHRQELERLRQMVIDDNLNSRIHEQYVDDQTLSPKRVAEYRQLMKSAGIVRLWAQGGGKPIEFLVDATGFLDVGTYKGFSYAEHQEGHIAKSLDYSCQPPNAKERYCDAVQSLGGHWWLVRYEYF